MVVFIWFITDFRLGYKLQKQNAKTYTQIARFGNCTILTTGHDVFKQLITDIENATSHIHILFYIFRDDHIGNQIIKKLCEKAREGVEVRLLVDRLGSDLSKKLIKHVKKEGVLFAYSHKPTFPYLFFTLNRRNHRKITVIDGRIGYLGGFNVGDEYLGRDPKFGDWRDIHLRICEDGVQDLQSQFIEDWTVANNRTLRDKKYYPPLKKGVHELKILPSDGSFLEDTFINFINSAESSLYIGTPYFIPGEPIKEALIKAAKRGVNIKIIVPKKGDHPFVKEASIPYFKPLLEAGCQIFEYYRGFYHAKTIILDEKLCDIGTANVDPRSFHLNHEINCIIYNRDLIKDVTAIFEHDIDSSQQLTLTTLKKTIFIQKRERKNRQSSCPTFVSVKLLTTL
ncbi:MAG: cardiolipin synthase [Bacillaceae bacterium]|nr:cardiolipin synthase [Bacillaceae bacterium]